MELHSLYRSPDIVRLIKSRRLKWADHVRIARMEERRCVFKILTAYLTMDHDVVGSIPDTHTILDMY